MLQENDEVDQRLSSIRDTSFSWESIDSQVGSRQSLLDNKGRSRLLVEEQEHSTEKVGGKAASLGGWCATPNGGDDMDLTRRQRDQRKKDIREKVACNISCKELKQAIIALVQNDNSCHNFTSAS